MVELQVIFTFLFILYCVNFIKLTSTSFIIRKKLYFGFLGGSSNEL